MNGTVFMNRTNGTQFQENVMKLYSHPLSLNCYKARLLLAFIDQEYEYENVDLVNDQHKADEFLAMHPLGQVPVLVDGGCAIWDSQAILVYLARKFENETWLPLNAKASAQITAWLSFAAKELATGLAAARVHHLLGGQGINFVTRLNIEIDRATAEGEKSLEVLNHYLSDHQWLAGDAPTIADIACFPAIEFAHEGKISLSAYPHVRTWVDQVKELPRYIPMRELSAPSA
jgi:glutathione S-transferase